MRRRHVSRSASLSEPTTTITRSLAAATARAFSNADAETLGLLAGCRVHVVRRHREATRAQVARHRQAHLSEPDHSDAANGWHACPAFLLSGQAARL
jgi:hypothetical protein